MWRARAGARTIAGMRTLLEVSAAVAGIASVLRGVRLATTRSRPLDLGGMVLAAAGLALAVLMITAASGALAR
jgi:hypothetical protein